MLRLQASFYVDDDDDEINNACYVEDRRQFARDVV